MSYELILPLKRGSVEIEFDDADDLERKLAALDVRRVERAVAAALSGRSAKAMPKKAKGKKAATKKAARKTRKKPAAGKASTGKPRRRAGSA